MHFDTLTKHSPVNSEKYAASFFDLVQEFERRLQDFWENNQYFAIFANTFSVCINMSPANFQMECIELQFWHSASWKIWSCVFPGVLYILSSQRHTSLASQSCLTHVIAIWQHLHLWATIFKNGTHWEKLEPKYLMSTLRTPWEVQLLPSIQILIY